VKLPDLIPVLAAENHKSAKRPSSHTLNDFGWAHDVSVLDADEIDALMS
jgi:hypothetical protein